MSEAEEKKSNSGFIMICVVLFVVFIGIGFVAKTYVMPKLVHHERTIDVNVLKADIKHIDELATLQYDYRDSIRIEKKKKPFGRALLFATFDGTIKAGIDLDNVDYDVQNPEPESEEPPIVNVSMPEAKILSHEDKNPNTLYEEGLNQKGLGDERNREIMKMKKKREKEFIAGGHLDEALDKSEDAIEDFIHAAYGDDVIVNFKESE